MTVQDGFKTANEAFKMAQECSQGTAKVPQEAKFAPLPKVNVYVLAQPAFALTASKKKTQWGQITSQHGP